MRVPSPRISDDVASRIRARHPGSPARRWMRALPKRHLRCPVPQNRVSSWKTIDAPSPDKTSASAEFAHWGGISRVTTGRSEEHTSELQSRLHLVCRLLLEKKK